MEKYGEMGNLAKTYLRLMSIFFIFDSRMIKVKLFECSLLNAWLGLEGV